MPLVLVAISVIVLLILMTKLKINGFVALLVVAVGVALLTPLPFFGTTAIGLADIPGILADGVGGQLDDTLMVIGLGAMIGRVMGDAGAAQRIAMKMIDRFGQKGVQVAMVVTAMLIGVTMFYEVAFVIIVPIAFTLVRATKSNLLWVGLPMSIALSTMHSFLPPHPGPTAVAGTYEASVGLTLAYGLLIAIPAGALVALVWPRLPFVKKMDPQIPAGLVSDKLFEEDEMPGLGVSLAMALFPVVIIAGGAVFELVAPDSPAIGFVQFISAAPVALLITLLLATWVFGPRSGRTLAEVNASASASAKPMAIILMVIGAGGAFKEVLTEAGIADYIANLAGGWNISPIILAWLIAVILRIALGSATVAVVTAAGIAAPLVAASGISPELMVLATSCGSIAFSHVNDPGFWMFKEYFGLSVTDALKTRTTYTTTLAILGLGGVLLLSTFIH